MFIYSSYHKDANVKKLEQEFYTTEEHERLQWGEITQFIPTQFVW